MENVELDLDYHRGNLKTKSDHIWAFHWFSIDAIAISPDNENNNVLSNKERKIIMWILHPRKIMCQTHVIWQKLIILFYYSWNWFWWRWCIK